jgi:hypothetical protein
MMGKGLLGYFTPRRASGFRLPVRIILRCSGYRNFFVSRRQNIGSKGLVVLGFGVIRAKY